MTRRSDGDNEDNDPDHASFQSTDSYGLNGDSTHAGDLTHAGDSTHAGKITADLHGTRNTATLRGNKPREGTIQTQMSIQCDEYTLVSNPNNINT